MTPGLQRFDIVLNNVDNTFSPGDVINGNVIIELGRPKTVRGITLRMKGKAQVKWSDSSGSGKDRTTTWYTNEEEYFRMEYNVLRGAGSDGNVVVESGHHVYPFEFCLPHNIPSSFEHDHGSVRYTIKAIIDRPWKFDHQTTMMFIVETPYDIAQCPTAMNVIEDDEVESFCCFPCINVGSMRVYIYVPRRGFSFGDTVQAKINIDNNSRSVEVEKIELSLVQKLELHARYPRKKTKKYSRTLERNEKSGPMEKKAEIIMSMQIPSAQPSSFPHCTIIDIEYSLDFEISVSGCHCSITRGFSILIGTRRALNSQPISNIFEISGSIGNPTGIFQPNAPPSAPFLTDGTSTVIPNIPFPMPMTNQQYPYAAAISNPSTTSGFQYGDVANAPIGFLDPNSTRNTDSVDMGQNPPPSYDDCIRMNEKKVHT